MWKSRGNELVLCYLEPSVRPAPARARRFLRVASDALQTGDITTACTLNINARKYLAVCVESGVPSAFSSSLRPVVRLFVVDVETCGICAVLALDVCQRVLCDYNNLS